MSKIKNIYIYNATPNAGKDGGKQDCSDITDENVGWHIGSEKQNAQ